MHQYIYSTAPRDFCLLRYWRQNTDGSHVVCLDSTVHTDCPLVAGSVRGELHAAYIISPPKDSAGSVDDESTECMLTFIAQLDPKGWIVSEFEYPRAMLQALMLHILDIRDTIDSDRFVQAQFDPANDERKAIVKGSVSDEPKGTIATTPAPALPPDMWSESDATAFRVRGASYNLDKVKCYSAPSMFKLLAIDLFEAPELATLNVGANPKNRVALAAQRGDPTWVFIVNVMVPGPPFLSFVAYFQGDPALFEQDTPFGRIAKRFFLGSEIENEFRNNRFKLIPRVLDGNILIKMAVKDTPAVIGTKLKQHYFKGDNYFEIDIDVGSSSIAR